MSEDATETERATKRIKLHIIIVIIIIIIIIIIAIVMFFVPKHNTQRK